jgi:GxxExxY protein
MLPQRLEDAKKSMIVLSQREEEIGKIIVDCAYKVHTQLGPGLLEKIYEICLCHELKKAGLNAVRQLPVSVVYDGITFEEGFCIDILVDDLVICELKAVDQVNPVWHAQILSHLRLTNKKLGYLINFNVPKIKEGIKRFVV